jgi:hypothetical protein
VVHKALGKKDHDIDVRTIARGVSWPSLSSLGSGSENIRALEGEIRVPSRISPGMAIAALELQVGSPYFIW